MERDELIKSYFLIKGYTNLEIIGMLFFSHQIIITPSELKRSLHRLGLRRREIYTDRRYENIIDAIRNELGESGKCLGYRSMWKRLLTKYKLLASRNTVMIIMKILDPDGVERRRRRRLLRREYSNPGPKIIWHVDGYDKLTPFGLCIHGAVDGFSRKIIWLNVYSTNRNPRVIAQYYLSAVVKLSFLPRVLRCDCGTENSLLEKIQPVLRMDSNDEFAGYKSIMYGKSTTNQRIESWWRILRVQMADYWITLFRDLRDSRQFNDADPMHVECLRFCFTRVIQTNLDTVVKEWNQHSITGKGCNGYPRGKPDILFNAPELYDTQNYGVPVNMDDALTIQRVLQELYPINAYGCSSEFLEITDILLQETPNPANTDEALALYMDLTNTLSTY